MKLYRVWLEIPCGIFVEAESEEEAKKRVGDMITHSPEDYADQLCIASVEVVEDA